MAASPCVPALDVGEDPELLVRLVLVVVLLVVAVLDGDLLAVLDGVGPWDDPLVDVGPGSAGVPVGSGRPDGSDLEVGSLFRLDALAGPEEREPFADVLVTSLGPTGRVSIGVRVEDSAVGKGALPVLLHAATTPTTMATARKAAAAATTHGGTGGPVGGLRWRPVIASSRRPP